LLGTHAATGLWVHHLATWTAHELRTLTVTAEEIKYLVKVVPAPLGFLYPLALQKHCLTRTITNVVIVHKTRRALCLVDTPTTACGRVKYFPFTAHSACIFAHATTSVFVKGLVIRAILTFCTLAGTGGAVKHLPLVAVHHTVTSALTGIKVNDHLPFGAADALAYWLAGTDGVVEKCTQWTFHHNGTLTHTTGVAEDLWFRTVQLLRTRAETCGVIVDKRWRTLAGSAYAHTLTGFSV
jgi:hypothetical protein